MKTIKILPLVALAAGLALASCTDVKSIETKIVHPWEEDSDMWDNYTQSLRDYKASEHNFVYVQLYNSPEHASGEQCFMRCLPDSLDFVALTNPAGLSEYDIEDLPMMKAKGTRVLLCVADPAMAQAAAAVAGGASLDGWQICGRAAAAAVSTLATSKAEGQWLVYDGEPSELSAEDRALVDLFILPTSSLSDVQDVWMKYLSATLVCGIPGEKLLFSATPGATIRNEERQDCDALTEMASRVIKYKPVAGLAVLGSEGDYYHADGNYTALRAVIGNLNR